MLVAWSQDADGNVVMIYGIFKTDAEVTQATMDDLAAGVDVHAGDIAEVTLTYTPPKAAVKR